MINITLPDGSVRQVSEGTSAMDIAISISEGLARNVLAAKVNDEVIDANTPLTKDVTLQLLTWNDKEGKSTMWHSSAHLMAEAIEALFPGVKLAIGPPVKNGFYYDVDFMEHSIAESDLERIEAKMKELAKQKNAFVRKEISKSDAIAYFEEKGDEYKLELIDGLEDGSITFYTQGGFTDLCRGPHIPNTGFIKAVKLLSIAGAYWRGDSKNAMLQRIYGTAWIKKEDQEAHLHMLAEAEKRDHRKIGKLLDLFHTQEEAPGMVFWHPKGWALWQVVEQYMRKVYRESGYQEVRCPQILDVSLWKQSGHWDNYKDNMFFTESEKRTYALKPMNCPGHILIFKQGIKSYRDLPLRYGEFGQCHRNEPSGGLHGIMRVRGFTQDDGHIFCTEDMILDECVAYTALLQRVYKDFTRYEPCCALKLMEIRFKI